MKLINKNIKGQALVLVLLSMSVVLTIVLFILSRSITDIATSTSHEEAVRAFSAAEAGIERALVVGAGTGNISLGDASYNASVTGFASGTKSFNYPISVESGGTATIWFSEHDQNGNIVCDGTHPCFTGSQFRVCWGKAGTPSDSATTPAIETIIFYETTPEDPATIKIARGAYDPRASRASTTGFATSDSGTCNINNVTYQFQKTITFSSLGIPAGSYNTAGGLVMARVRMFYNTTENQDIATTVNFAGSSNLPSQGQQIESTGVSGNSTRKVRFFQGWPEVPVPFEYAIYSSTSLTK